MQAPENKRTEVPEDRLEIATPEAFEQDAPDTIREEWRHSFWDSLVSFWGGGEPQHRLEFETLVPETGGADSHHGWRIDEWDFSAEHGYEPGFEGRSEFEHGEFERWL